MVNLKGNDHILFKSHLIFFGIVTTQPRRFIDTQSHAVKTIETRKFRRTVLAESGEELRARSRFDQGQRGMQALVTLPVAVTIRRRRSPAAEGAGEITIVTTWTRHRGIAND